MAGLRRPPLYRASRYCAIAATLVAVLILVYVGVAVYSASQLRPGGANGSSVGTNAGAQGFEVSTVVNFSNPGFLPVDRVQLSSVVYSPGNVTLLVTGSSPNVTIAPASVGHIPLTLWIPDGGSPAARALLTQDEVLPTTFWANVTFAHLFQILVQVNSTIDWGAPFEGLNVTVGSPQASNGSVEVPLTLAFTDDASFPVDGTLALTLNDAAGGRCDVAVAAFPLAVAPHQGEDATETVDVPTGCAYPAGSTIAGAYSSTTWSADLPTETIP